MPGYLERTLRATLPPSAFGALSRLKRRMVRPFSGATESDVVAAIHRPLHPARGGAFHFNDAPAQPPAGEFPVPPARLRMGYALESDEAFLASGARTAAMIRSILADHGAKLGKVGPALEWGCASARVLRHFAAEAAAAEFWGAEPDEACVRWARASLSPPFRFVTSTAIPHLPFEDGQFGFVYGISVFTHLERLRDAWLMEIRRILRPGGWALFTVHDESTVAWFQEKGRPAWLPHDLPIEDILRHDETVVAGPDWSWVFTFLKSDHIRREWGQFFEIVEIRPRAEGYQSAVLMRKR